MMSNILSKLIGQNTRKKPNAQIICGSDNRCGDPDEGEDNSATFRVINGRTEFVRCGC